MNNTICEMNKHPQMNSNTITELIMRRTMQLTPRLVSSGPRPPPLSTPPEEREEEFFSAEEFSERTTLLYS